MNIYFARIKMFKQIYLGYVLDSIYIIDKNDDTCPMRVDCNAQSVSLVTIGKQNYPLPLDEMKTMKLKASDIQQASNTFRTDS